MVYLTRSAGVSHRAGRSGDWLPGPEGGARRSPRHFRAWSRQSQTLRRTRQVRGLSSIQPALEMSLAGHWSSGSLLGFLDWTLSASELHRQKEAARRSRR
ncbi:hypothetical protein BO78DRAFT_3243 [Aspergillus sclerotiicarbonarius CBS 121057]|uniref:Uncharacterized protein n=1 Tax=Aspergillus sclerotiicarbonarius (strain CBS 121057 / IBT 28362) TaxID=1448318 RepID=A0A319EWG5_ASPSB|nr:hypothetical protein BO78DRAFT_3243 [Aspergillus sclerotiicarbonarius CBS 121057]